MFPKVSGDVFYNRKDMDGTGITVPGLRASLFSFLNMSFEYRIKKGYFVPQFFDGSYDLSRVVAEFTDSGTLIRTKDQVIFADSTASIDTKGMFGSASANLFNLISFNASYANMKADTVEFNSFSALINLNAENIPKLSVAQAYYQRNNDKNPFDFNNPSINTVFGYKLGYEVSQGVSLIWDFRQFYRDTGTGLKPVKQTTIETAFDFWYMDSKTKTVFRYDSGARGFNKAAFLLLALASILGIFGYFWIISFIWGMEMTITIEYCNSWNYLPRAASMATELLEKYGNSISGLELIPSGGGVYEVTKNGKLIFSKKNEGRFPDINEIENLLEQ